ncbi:hypothetical protein KP509_03G048400 [Ceratopteris richardii]|uniref:Xylose isomerase n=3 Tax=Ceratopteris richardii TaxID=49495 RepID=A0A8T2V7G7_CERRI|nr:hypothetical protein KP509_03G048400 [Ceratopteris richardii]KAH7441675.1 hypothetical protein KP509_03G048400 [Ceratopteris richardii]
MAMKGLMFIAVSISCILCACSEDLIADMTCRANLENDRIIQEWKGEFFPNISYIRYEGPTSRNPLAFKWYNAEEEILGKKMKDWLRFSVAFWHTFRGDGTDIFGSPTKRWPWDDGTDSLTTAFNRMRANFEFLQKLGVSFWCFHDRDIAPEGKTLKETNANLDAVVALAKRLQEGTNINPLWGTAQLFKHQRYMHGAATSPYVNIFAYGAAQVKKAMEVTHELGGQNFVFWGGREGYQTLLNTDMKKELENMAQFLKLASMYKKKLGFQGTLLLEPKPQEPTKHQYDWDVATTMGFLEKHGLSDQFKLNIECNHATLAGHSCTHELEMARIHGMFGSFDANTGDAQTGWDTDQFLVDIAEATLIMLTVIKNGGISPGGFNFDAKLRRESVDVEDLFIAHIAGMDTMARGLRNAARIVQDGALQSLVDRRYSSFDSPLGKAIKDGSIGFEELEQAALNSEDQVPPSGKQELAEMIFYSFVQ